MSIIQVWKAKAMHCPSECRLPQWPPTTMIPHKMCFRPMRRTYIAMQQQPRLSKAPSQVPFRAPVCNKQELESPPLQSTAGVRDRALSSEIVLFHSHFRLNDRAPVAPRILKRTLHLGQPLPWCHQSSRLEYLCPGLGPEACLATNSKR